MRAFLQRPAKAALALALAGCAVGGVAVAAGAGVLPGPFGRASREPAPATVTAADGAGGATVAPGPTRGATQGPRSDRRPDASGTPGRGTRTPGAADSSAAGAPSESPRRGDKPGKGATGEPGGDTGAVGEATDTGRSLVAKLCRDFLANGKQRGGGKGVDEEDLRALERSAGGSAAVRAYCERLLAADGKGGGSSDGGADGDGSDLDDLLRGGKTTKPRSRSLPRTSVPEPLSTTGVTLSEPATL